MSISDEQMCHCHSFILVTVISIYRIDPFKVVGGMEQISETAGARSQAIGRHRNTWAIVTGKDEYPAIFNFASFTPTINRPFCLIN